MRSVALILSLLFVAVPNAAPRVPANNTSSDHQGPTAPPRALATSPSDVAISFPGGHGSWIASWTGSSWAWTQLHGLDFGPMATGDFDGNGLDDLVVYLPGSGVWIRYDNATWRLVRDYWGWGLTQRPAAIVTGDLDGNGQADIFFDDFPSGYGAPLVRWMNNGAHLLRDTSWPIGRPALATGDIDGNNRAELLAGFHGDPTYPPTNSSGTMVLYQGFPGDFAGGWTRVCWCTPRTIVAGDFDGNGRTDVALDAGPPYGVYLWMNPSSPAHASFAGTWISLTALSPQAMAAGDIDGDGQRELIISFPGAGLYTWKATSPTPSPWSGWRLLHYLDVHTMTTGDVDGNGQADVVIDFGEAGVWVWMNDSTWVLLHWLDAGAIATGHLLPR